MLGWRHIHYSKDELSLKYVLVHFQMCINWVCVYVCTHTHLRTSPSDYTWGTQPRWTAATRTTRCSCVARTPSVRAAAREQYSQHTATTFDFAYVIELLGPPSTAGRTSAIWWWRSSACCATGRQRPGRWQQAYGTERTLAGCGHTQHARLKLFVWSVGMSWHNHRVGTARHWKAALNQSIAVERTSWERVVVVAVVWCCL